MANLVIIRDLCEKNNITLRQLAARIGRDESSLQSAMRRGSTNTSTLEAIARELGVSAGVFFDDYQETQKVEALKKDIEHLNALLAEKERTIAILMADRK